MRFAMITLAAALSLAAVAPAQAQDTTDAPRRMRARAERMDPAQMIDRRVKMLTEQLDLSADQAAKIKTILTKESEQMREHFQKMRPADGAQRQRPTDEQREAMRAEMQKVREQTKGEIGKVLNADQLKKYEELQKREPRGEGMGRRARMQRQ